MKQKFNIDGLECLCATNGRIDRIAYILYPMDMLADWVETASQTYGTTIVVITGMDWQNVFSPWPARGVPKGSPDFTGEAPAFLDRLHRQVVPLIESKLGIAGNVKRTLVGVSMSGLFAVWQWILCDMFTNIASLSGSFWYDGFMDWLKEQQIPRKSGKAFFLLGDQESKSKVKAFDSVGVNTQEIIGLLRQSGVNVTFESVPGNHYSNPIPRLDKAFSAIYQSAE